MVLPFTFLIYNPNYLNYSKHISKILYYNIKTLYLPKLSIYYKQKILEYFVKSTFLKKASQGIQGLIIT